MSVPINLSDSLPYRGSGFQYSSRSHPCPICGRRKDTDCRWKVDKVYFCHTYQDGEVEIPGLIYRGSTEIWGMYFKKEEKYTKSVRPKARKEFIYNDLEGNPLVKVTRIDDGDGKKQFYQSHWNGKEWVKGVPEEFRVRIRLYRISDAVNQNAITQGKSVLIVEGEGIVDVLLKMGIAAICSIGGAGKWRKYGHQNYLEDLKGAKVVLCPDLDKPGINHCLDIEKDFPNAQWLYAYPDSPDWLEPPTKGGLDIADWVHDHKLTSEQIIAAIEPKRKFALDIDPLLQMKDHSILEEDPDLKPAKSKKTSGELLLEIAERGHYFRTPDKVAYVDVSINGVRHTLPLRGKDFKGWLRHQYFCIHGKGIGSEILNQVLGVLEAKACFEGETRDVYLRLAWHQDKIYLDLGTEDWSAVEIDENGWRIVTDYPVRFRRPKTLLPLFQPDPKGRIADLRPLLNVDDDNWVLVITFLLFCFYPRHPHPVLFLTGEQGVGKSFAAMLLKSLGDPGKAPLIPAVADLRNLAIQAQNRWIVAYDNLSYISVDQSDAVCRISTGGGFSTRALFENDEEVVFEFIRPQILTGIGDLASRGDLLERSLVVKLSPIPEEERKLEADLKAEIERLSGRILGALLNALSQTLKTLPETKVDRLPRMADFARFAVAAEPALGLPPGSFLRVYAGNQQEAHETVLESSPVATAVQRFMACRVAWEGSPTELLAELEDLMDERTLKSKAWAGSPSSLGRALSGLAPALRGVGIDITKPDRKAHKRFYRIERMAYPVSLPSSLSQGNQQQVSSHDSSLLSTVIETMAPVISVNAGNQALQPSDDTYDSSDTKVQPSSSLVGKTVRKQGKYGWRGVVQTVEGDLATVLWHTDEWPSTVMLAELEVIA